MLRTEPNAGPSHDLYEDFALRILMGAVFLALIGCLLFLAHRWTQIEARTAVDAPVVEIDVPHDVLAAHEEPQPRSAPQVLLAPGQVYRCNDARGVTYTDRPCPNAQRLDRLSRTIR